MFNGDAEDNLIFLAEVEELLLIMEDGLLKLERDGFDEPSLNEVFRSAHTIKGGAGLLGITPLADATHLLEDLLDAVRAKQVALDERVLNALLESLDWLGRAKGQLQAGLVPQSDSALTKRLAMLLPEGERANTASKQDKATPVVKSRCSLVINFPADAPLLSVRAFQALSLVGEHCQVVSSEPSEEMLIEDIAEPTLRIYLNNDPEGMDFADLVRRIPEAISYQVEVSEQAIKVDAHTDEIQRNSRTIRISVDLLDELLALAGELVVDRARLGDVLARMESDRQDQISDQLRDIADHMGRITTQLQEGIMRGRLVPLNSIFRKFPRMVRDLSKSAGKQVQLAMSGEGTELDRSVMEYIDDPLVHILRNAVDHGLESPAQRIARGKPQTGTVRLSAEHAQNQIVISIQDDGHGIDPEKLKRKAVANGILTEEAAARLNQRQALELIFAPGFSTAEKVTEVSGRGVGLDVVKTNLRRISGRIDVESEVGQGTTFFLYLPLTLAIIHGLLVSSSDLIYAFPVASVIEAVPVKPEEVHTITNQQVLAMRNHIYPFLPLDVLLGVVRPSKRLTRYALLVHSQTGSLALGVDSILGEQEIVIKELGAYIGQIAGVSGATILGDGNLALIIDPSTLLDITGGRSSP